MEIITKGHYCSWFKVFKINGIDARVEDFGESYDDEPWNAPDYGCGHRCFHPYAGPKMWVLEKYGITCEEWESVCKRLEEELYVGGCADCE